MSLLLRPMLRGGNGKTGFKRALTAFACGHSLSKAALMVLVSSHQASLRARYRLLLGNREACPRQRRQESAAKSLPVAAICDPETGTCRRLRRLRSRDQSRWHMPCQRAGNAWRKAKSPMLRKLNTMGTRAASLGHVVVGTHLRLSPQTISVKTAIKRAIHAIMHVLLAAFLVARTNRSQKILLASLPQGGDGGCLTAVRKRGNTVLGSYGLGGLKDSAEPRLSMC